MYSHLHGPDSIDSAVLAVAISTTGIRHRIILYLNRRCRFYEDAEDIYEDAIMTLLRLDDSQRLKNTKEIESLLFHIALNKWNNYRRQQARRAKYVIKGDESDKEIRSQVAYNNPELAIDLHIALNKLPSHDRFLIKEWEQGLSYEELAAKHEVTLSCLRMRLKRAKSKVALEMEGYRSPR